MAMAVAEVASGRKRTKMTAEGNFPPEVEFVISALEAGPRPILDRQRQPRMIYRVKASLRLHSDAADGPAWLLYTRHVNTRAVGFISPRPLPLSHGGMLSILAPDGSTLEVACTILRCRQVANNWYEGAVYFNREQEVFAAEG